MINIEYTYIYTTYSIYFIFCAFLFGNILILTYHLSGCFAILYLIYK